VVDSLLSLLATRRRGKRGGSGRKREEKRRRRRRKRRIRGDALTHHARRIPERETRRSGKRKTGKRLGANRMSNHS